MKYQIFSRFEDKLIIEGNDYTQRNHQRMPFTVNEQDQFRYMEESGQNETISITKVYVINQD